MINLFSPGLFMKCKYYVICTLTICYPKTESYPKAFLCSYPVFVISFSSKLGLAANLILSISANFVKMVCQSPDLTNMNLINAGFKA